MKKFSEKRNRPRQGTPEHFAGTLQRLIDNPAPPDGPYVAPCGGTGNHSDPSWWEERFEDRIYEDDDESFGAQLIERAQEAIELRERLARGYRVYGWDKIERPTSVI